MSLPIIWINLNTFTFSSGFSLTPWLPSSYSVRWASADALVRFAASSPERHSAIQRQIHHQLERNLAAQAWKRSRCLLRNAPHFSLYRTTAFGQYNSAARQLARKAASAAQKSLAKGLLREIKSSRVRIPPGQLARTG